MKHYHTRYHFSYHTSARHRLSTVLGVTALIVLVLLFIFHNLTPTRPFSLDAISVVDVFLATVATIWRLMVAYILAVLVAIPLVVASTSHPRAEKILLPIFDIFQSVPALAFFPVIILVFIKFNFFDGAAIFVLFMAMVWNLVFSMVGGIKTIPIDIQNAATVFGARGLNRLRFVTLPAIFPYIITGSLLAWGSAWTIIIVAEVLHNFIPNSSAATDLLGLGSLLADSAFQGNNLLFLISLLVMVVVISLMNYFVWQKLLHLGERYKFD